MKFPKWKLFIAKNLVLARIFWHSTVYLFLFSIFRILYWEKQVAIGWIIVSLIFSPAMIFLLLAVIFLFLFSDCLFDKLTAITISENEFLTALKSNFVFLNNKNYQIEKLRLFRGSKKGKIICRRGKSRLEIIFFKSFLGRSNFWKNKYYIEHASWLGEKLKWAWIILIFVFITSIICF